MTRRLLLSCIGICCIVGIAQAQTASAGKLNEFQGKVIAAKDAEIAARVDGRLAKINFSAGQVVKKGDLLFEFDTKFREINLAAARARLNVLEAQLRLAEVKLKNAETLRTRKVSSEMQLLEARAQREVAAASVEEANANVAAAQLQLDQTALRAPFDGMVSRASVLEGAYLTLQAMDKNRLATITQLDPIQVVADVPFDVYQQSRSMFDSRAEASGTLSYTLVLPNGVKYLHAGRLVAGSGEFDPATQSMAIVVEFQNPDFLLRPGLAVTLQSSAQ